MEILCLIFVFGSLAAGLSLEAEAKGQGWRSLSNQGKRQLKRRIELDRKLKRPHTELPRKGGVE